jgi:thiol-disulfide isomerase/thioredoxin
MRRDHGFALVLILAAMGCARSAPAPAGQSATGAAGDTHPAIATDGPGASKPGSFAPDGSTAPGAAPAGSAPAAPDNASAPAAAAPVTFGDLDGLLAELAARRKSGRPVLLNFWATWCAPCVDELPALGNLSRELGAKDPEIIGVALDALTVPERERIEPKVRDMLTQSRVSYSNYVLMGEQEKFMKEFDVSGGIPLSILYDGGGKMVQRWIGTVEMNDLRHAFQSLPHG